MPRMSEARRNQFADSIVVAISSEMARQRLTRKKLEKYIPISTATLTRRLSKPDEFTVSELCSIANALNVSIYTLVRGGKTDV